MLPVQKANAAISPLAPAVKKAAARKSAAAPFREQS
jgi:hypothetical protein